MGSSELSQSLLSVLASFHRILDDDNGWTATRWDLAVRLDDMFLKLKLWKQDIGYDVGVLDKVQTGSHVLSDATKFCLFEIKAHLDELDRLCSQKLRYDILKLTIRSWLSVMCGSCLRRHSAKKWILPSLVLALCFH
jgi:hypothetical protein